MNKQVGINNFLSVQAKEFDELICEVRSHLPPDSSASSSATSGTGSSKEGVKKLEKSDGVLIKKSKKKEKKVEVNVEEQWKRASLSSKSKSVNSADKTWLEGTNVSLSKKVRMNSFFKHCDFTN